MALVAILSGSLGDFVAYLLDLPEWRLPREYNRAEYDPAEFCIYLLHWVFDGYDTTFLFFGLLGTLVEHLIKFWQYCQRSGHAQEPLDAAVSLSHEELDALMGGYLEEILGDAGGKLEGMSSVVRETIAALRTRANDSETSCDVAHDTIADLEGTNGTLQSQNSDLMASLYTHQQTVSSIESANMALESQNTVLKIKLGAEEDAKQREVEKSSKAMAKMEAQMKRLEQQAEEAEQALRKKDVAIRTAEQKQQQLQIRFEFANERIGKLEEEAEERKSEREALQDRAETAESNEHFSKKKLESSESQRQTLQRELDTTRKEFSQIRKEFNKAAKDVSTLQNELTTANEVTKTKEAECEQLKDDKSALKQKCTHLEQDYKVLNTAKMQREEANSKLITQLNTKLEQADERENKLKRQHSSDKNRLQEQLKTANSEIQELNERSRLADLENAKLTERCDKADRAIEKLQQEYQSKQEVQQEEIFKAQSQTQKAQETLKDCQQALKCTRDMKDKQSIDHKLALEAKDKELKEAVRSNKAANEKLETCKMKATEKTADHDKEMAHAQAELKTLQDDLDLKSSTIKSLEGELQFASVEVTEAREIAQLVESEKWHVYAKMQEAWILESNTAIQDQLEQAKLDIQFLEVALEGRAEEHKAALEEKDKALANQGCQCEEAARNADVDLGTFSDEESARGLDINELETERPAEEGIQGAESKRSRRKKGGRMHQARNYVKHIQRQLDYALDNNDGSTNAVDNVRSLQAQVNQAWEATRRKEVSDAPTEQQPEKTIASRPHGL